ncbi:MAG: hypothetical protein FD155_3415 [Bacteroidetes bacterium]|nr:MAG: hypothetical protein FD155_3415 [Bacteroidota bacterium]
MNVLKNILKSSPILNTTPDRLIRVKMEKHLSYLMLIMTVILPFLSQAQNWSTFGGSNSRSGNSEITGPSSVSTPFWQITNASNTLLGEQVYSFGDLFVNSRVAGGFASVKIECRNLQTGALVWVSPFIAANSKLYCMGFSEDAVYACDYATDSVYALHVADGSIKWVGELTSQSYGARESVVFTCNGDIILNGPGFGGPTTMRLNKDTGKLVWGNDELYAVSPVGALALMGDKVYRITGAINQPIRLAAFDVNTGVSSYFSDPLPGDGDQENQLFLDDQSAIYFWRDNGFLYSFSDNGTQLKENWHFTSSASPPTGSNNSRIAIGNDHHIYAFDDGKIIRINYEDGSLMNTSTVSIAGGSITIGADSTVYVSNENNAFYALSYDLQTVIWQYSMNNNAFGSTLLAKDGIMVMTGAGATIKAFKPNINRKPVADFRVSGRKTGIGEPVNFMISRLSTLKSGSGASKELTFLFLQSKIL